jgi:hypothetical protein
MSDTQSIVDAIKEVGGIFVVLLGVSVTWILLSLQRIADVLEEHRTKQEAGLK